MNDDEEFEQGNSYDAYHARLTKAISSAAADDEIVLKWTAVVEVLDGSGERGLWCVSDEHSTSWDLLGLLEFAIQKAKSGVDMATWAQSSIQIEDDDTDDS